MDRKPGIQNIYTLTPLQEGILFHTLLDEGTGMYLDQTSFDVNGSLDMGVLEKSFNLLIERYDVLRTVFSYKKSKKPLQIVLTKRSAKIYFEDISSMGESERINFIEEFKEKDREKGFDLSKDILMRVSVLKTDSGNYKIIWTQHHIIMDGWSLGIIMSEFFRIYNSLRKNEPVKLEKVRPYSDFIGWLEKQDREKARSYWGGYLESCEKQTVIPGYSKTGAQEKFTLREVNFTIDEALTRGLQKTAADNGVTLSIVFQAVWGILLQKYNYTGDVVFGLVVSGRPASISGIENVAGLFINTIPVRIKCGDTTEFSGLIREMQEQALASDRYSYMQLAEIQALTPLKQGLVGHAMAFESYPVDNMLQSLEDEEVMKLGINHVETFEQVNYDFGLLAAPGRELGVKLTYNPHTYNEEFIRSIEGHMKEVVKAVINNAGIRINEIEIVTEEEKRNILHKFNDIYGRYPVDRTLHELFEEQAEKTPGSTAVVFENEQLTYGELNERANRLARVLREKGVGRGSITGILAERSLEMVTGILGILKAGGAYLPIDPAYPEDRIMHMLNDSGAKTLLSHRRLAGRIQFGGHILDIGDESIYRNRDSSNLGRTSMPGDPAYVIFTSGSTGKPKGVMIEHGGISAKLQWRRDEYKLGCNDASLQLFSHSFDGFVTSFFTPIISGARVILLKEDEAKDGAAIKKHIVSHGITNFICVPSLYHAIQEFMNPEDMRSLRVVTLAGEKAAPHTIAESKSKNAGLELVNEYGPTECSVVATIFRNMQPDTSAVIGRPAAETKVYVVDRHNKLLPPGVPGELCIGGSGLARGYLNRPELSTEKFVPNPFAPGERMYRTGDMARWLPGGYLEFLGRLDCQVKIRGFRIETAEIENRLKLHDGVKDAAVEARENAAGSKYLCAYIEADKTENCLFKKNEHVFYFKDSYLWSGMFGSQGSRNDMRLVKTNRGNYAAVDDNTLLLLDCFNGKNSLKSVFSSVSKTGAVLTVWWVNSLEKKADMVKKSYVLNESFDEFVSLIHDLGRLNLIEPSGYSHMVTQPDTPAFLNPDSSGAPVGGGQRPALYNGNESAALAGDKVVLLLGDTVGTSTTGILYIASYLRRNGIKAFCRWNDLNRDFSSLEESIIDLLKTVRPQIVGISMKWFPHIARVIEMCRIIKEYSEDIKVVLGGNTASYYWEELSRYKCIDYIIKGDGEVPFLKICLEEEDIPNCVYKRDGTVINNPVTYIQNEENSRDIYLSHLEDIFVSREDPLYSPYFFIYTGKGCSAGCFYCAGCQSVQKATFGRAKPYMRGIDEVRKDLIEARKYTGTFMFDFDLPHYDSMDYYKRIWEGLDLADHFCSFYFWKLPTKEFLELVTGSFRYVYLNIDLCSLSEEHRMRLTAMKVVKPQPSDAEILAFLRECEKLGKVEVTINLIAGLPEFTREDIASSERMLEKLLAGYKCFKGIDWGRLHAQPGTALSESSEAYGMNSAAKTFEDFLHYSELNLKDKIYPDLANIHYPYIYYNSDSFNSEITRHYMKVTGRLRERNEDGETGNPEDWERKLKVPELREYLSRELPEYMIPSYFVFMERLPVSPNGKLDRKSLPGPEGLGDTGAEYEAPANETEKALVDIWKDILGIERIGINDNFFELGGHSLSATTLAARIFKEFDVEILLREIFKHQTVKQQARCINEASRSAYDTIQPAGEKEYYPLSSAQRRLYILNRLEGPSTSYNTPSAMLIEGNADEKRIEEIFTALAGRHEILRTYFETVDGEPVQRIQKEAAVNMSCFQCRPENIQDTINRFIRPFDLSKAPLLRVGLARVTDGRRVLMLDMHHIIADGMSMNILISEFTALYNWKTLPGLRIQYKDYSQWQSSALHAGTMKKQEEYWLKVFDGEIPGLGLPADYPRPSELSFEGDQASAELSLELTRKLNKISKETGTTLYMVMLAGYNILLSKYAGQEDIVVGLPIAGRTRAELHSIIGMFVNLLAMRNYPKRDKTFREFLEDVRRKTIEAYENQDYPFDELVGRLGIRRDLGRSPLFDVIFVLQNIEFEEPGMEDLQLSPYPIENTAVQYDISLVAAETKGAIRLTADFRKCLYKKETIERLLEDYIKILDQVCGDMEIRLGSIELLNEEEKNLILSRIGGNDEPVNNMDFDF